MTEIILNEDELAVIANAKDFAAGYVSRHCRSWEMDRQMPRDVFQAAAEAGLCGLLVRQDRGGIGIRTSALLKVLEELSYVDLSVAFALVVHNNHARFIDTTGTEEMITDYLPKMIAGEMVGAFLLTEPQGGSDAAAITTSALPDGEGYILNGEKAWITNAPHADLLNVFVQTDQAIGAKGIASLQVPVDTPGVVRMPAYEMLGCHALGAGGLSL